MEICQVDMMAIVGIMTTRFKLTRGVLILGLEVTALRGWEVRVQTLLCLAEGHCHSTSFSGGIHPPPQPCSPSCHSSFDSKSKAGDKGDTSDEEVKLGPRLGAHLQKHKYVRMRSDNSTTKEIHEEFPRPENVEVPGIRQR